MSEKCPVCKNAVSSTDEKCSVCGFSDLHKDFITKEDAESWMQSVVEPYREVYEKRHQQLEENKTENIQKVTQNTYNNMRNSNLQNHANNISNIRSSNKRKIFIILSVVFVIAVIAVAIVVALLPCKHKVFSAATCTMPSVCEKCNQELNKVLGHDFSIEATCTTALKCSRCDVTQGNSLGHEYLSQPTCTEGVNCQRCSYILPENGHEWESASCLLPLTCKVCSETEGEPLGHSEFKGVCNRCDEIMGKIIYNDGKVIAHYIDMEMVGHTVYVNLVVTNNTDETLTVQTREAYLNGRYVSAHVSEDISRESSEYCRIYIGLENKYGIEKLQDISTFKFQLFLNNYYYDYFTSNFIQVKPVL